MNPRDQNQPNISNQPTELLNPPDPANSPYNSYYQNSSNQMPPPPPYAYNQNQSYNNPPPNKNNSGLIVGIIGGIAAVVAIAALVIFLVLRPGTNNNQVGVTTTPPISTVPPVATTPAPNPTESSRPSPTTGSIGSFPTQPPNPTTRPPVSANPNPTNRPPVTPGNTNGSTFPQYPAIQKVSVPATLSNQLRPALSRVPGGKLEAYVSKDAPADIKAFYQEQLKKASWSDLSDAASSMDSQGVIGQLESLGGFFFVQQKGATALVLMGLPGEYATALGIKGAIANGTVIIVIEGNANS